MGKYNKSEWNLKEGDFIGITIGNRIERGLFIGYGVGDNVHFLSFWRAKALMNQKTKTPVYVDFINRHAEGSVVKLSLEDLSENIIEEYLTLKTYYFNNLKRK